MQPVKKLGGHGKHIAEKFSLVSANLDVERKITKIIHVLLGFDFFPKQNWSNFHLMPFCYHKKKLLESRFCTALGHFKYEEF